MIVPIVGLGGHAVTISGQKYVKVLLTLANKFPNADITQSPSIAHNVMYQYPYPYSLT